MIQDAIIQEVRAIRDEVAREHDYDIDTIFEALRKAEASSGREHVTLKPRKTAQQPLHQTMTSRDCASPQSSLLSKG